MSTTDPNTASITAPIIDSVAALGGGHGLYATLQAVRQIAQEVTAVVTVADDGGSSGRLRSELGVMPPGDLRMALAALAAPTEHAQLWAETLQHRFGGSGALAGHPVGNLLLAGLTEVLGNPVAALDEVGELLGVRGRVLPMTDIPLEIEADVQGLESDPRVSRVIRGQVVVATTPGKVRRVRLVPENPPAGPEAVAALAKAQLVVLGPGSWLSSVIPHVLVPGIRQQLQDSNALKVLILNLVPEPGETAGFSAERHLHVLAAHAPELRMDVVVVDRESVPPGRERDHLARAAASLGAQVHYGDVSRGRDNDATSYSGAQVHDPTKLAATLATLWRSWTATEGGSEVASSATTGRKEHAPWR